MRVFITGGTGLLGSQIVELLRERGDAPVVLSRDAGRAAARLGAGVEVVEGDPQQAGDWTAAVDGCDAVINLAGEPAFDRRWNAAQKARLRDSRVRTTENVVKAIEAAKAPPGVLVSASAIGYYGDVPEGEVTEDTPPGDDFLARLCQDWEAAALAANSDATRVVVVRVGVVLASHGGALKQMLLPFKLGLGGPVGRGRQWVSWIHLEDMARVFLAGIDNPQLKGPVNGTAPQPERNKEFSKCLARALHRPCLLPVPPFMLRLMFGEVAMVMTTGQRVLPTRLASAGFEFKYPQCAEAMRALFERGA